MPHRFRARVSAAPGAHKRWVMGVALMCASLAGSATAGELQVDTTSHIDAVRLQANLEHLSEIGRDPAGGITRLGLSQAELEAHTYAVGLMTDAGLTVRIDAAGSRLAPMGMIFVPSHAGISHAPQEFTAPGDVANGVEVLYRTILLLDKQLGAK